MLNVPKEKPAVENLNSYYLDIRKLIEHYQGQLGSGCIRFKAVDAQGVIFFDQNEVIEGIFSRNQEQIHGELGIDELIETAGGHNFSVDIYAIDPNEIVFWVGISKAEEIYKNLSTEFTDFNALIAKMKSEKFTGYIDVTLKSGQDSAILFLQGGRVVSGSFTWGQGEGHEENIQMLIRKIEKSGGIFNVGRIEPDARTATAAPAVSPADVIPMLEDLLTLCENMVNADKKIKVAFETLLKKKLIQKADQYAFLDPFAAEFEYGYILKKY